MPVVVGTQRVPGDLLEQPSGEAGAGAMYPELRHQPLPRPLLL